MTEVLLKASDLTCERDDRILFQNLSLHVRPGNLIRIGGANGAGKTTLLRILAGLSFHYTGELQWRGQSVARARETYLANLLFMGHRAAITPALTPMENLESFMRMRQPVTRADLMAALAAAGLEFFEDIPARNLSAGQQRRIALARLYLSTEPLWILDEAFTAIDREAVAALEQLLLQRSRAGGAVILTTHHPLTLPGCEEIVLGGRG